jgi:iron complex transport system substrate-binding protein
MSTTKSILLAIVIVATFGRCGTTPSSDKNELKQPTETTFRVISAAPLITEVIFALGMEKQLVGRTNYCSYPAQVAQIASIGSIREPNIETIIALKPDVVITSTHFLPSNEDKLKSLGIKVERVFNQQNHEGAYQTIREVATLLNCLNRGDSLVSLLQSRHNELKKRVLQRKKQPSIYYVVGYGKGGDFTAGGNTFINDLIVLAGGINIAAGIDQWRYNLEDLLANDPDMVLVRQGWKDDFCTTFPYNRLKAVKQNTVYEIDNHQFELNGPRIMDALDTLITLIERFEER